jgi:hypothetical protein
VARRSNAASARRVADQLFALRREPERAAALALEIVASDSNPEIVRFAVEALVSHPLAAAHNALVSCYQRFDAPKRDVGGFTRASLISALRPIALPSDAAVFERAATTFEPAPGDAGSPAVLRARGLVALNDLDDQRAGYLAARLLADRDHVSANGEPAATAARVLAVNGETELLFYLAGAGTNLPGEIRAECLRGLVDVPGDLLGPILAEASNTADELVLLALCDLLVAHRTDPAVTAALERFLAACRSVDVYRYVTAAVAASRAPDLVAALIRSSANEFGREKLDALAEVLPLMAAFPGARDAEDLIAGRRTARAARAGESAATP